ncbi:MAG TPA: toxin secretion, membrane fusion protein [bacterium]|nr:toxin secretion, membrane fusion protein [bacterium]
MREIKKVITKKKLSDLKNDKSDLNYWLSKTTDERILAVEELRSQYAGSEERLQRVVRIIKRKKS